MPTPPGYAQISMQFVQSGLVRPAYITFGVDQVDTDPAVVATNILGAWSSAGSLKSIMDNTVTMTGIRVAMGTDGSADIVYVLTTSDAGGVVGAQTTPPNVALLVRKITARGGRRGRGRIYIPWVTATSVVSEAGIITPSNLTTMQTALNTWRSLLATNQVPMVVLHKPGLSAVGSPDPVTSLSADRLVATQRRRLGR